MTGPPDDSTLSATPSSAPRSPPPDRHRQWWRGLALAVTGLMLVGAGIGVGAAVAGTTPAATPAVAPAAHGTARSAKAGGKHAGVRTAVDPARQAWAHQYGLDRASMPNLPDVAVASPQQQAAATDLLVRTQTATAQYADPAKALAAGFDLQASLARAEKKRPGLARTLQRVDAGTAAKREMPMLHVGNKANRADGKVLDPTAPETLMYGYQGHGSWTLMGVMYTANETYPQPPPDPGGPITRWHYHDRSGGQALMMHIFFVSNNDLAHAYAADMTTGS